jgi:hypothetical protein
MSDAGTGHHVLIDRMRSAAREPRNGRNFQYGSEDSLLAANIVAAQRH